MILFSTTEYGVHNVHPQKICMTEEEKVFFGESNLIATVSMANDTERG